MTAPVKPSGTLKQFLDTKKVETRLTGPIERHLLTRPRDTSRRTDVIHPSALIKHDFCVRASYFTLTGQAIKEEDRPGLRLQSIFDEGHSIHAKWQAWLREMGVLYGAWECRVCDHYWWAQSPPNCPSCESALVNYREVPVFDESLMIAGHSDGWVKGIGDDYMIEIKSVGAGTIRMEQPSLLASNDGDVSKAFRDIRRPFPSHLRQGLLYLELARRMVEDGELESAPTEIVYLYELKADQAYKEFVVRANRDIVEDCLERAAFIAFAVRTEDPPPCSNDPVKGCKACRPAKAKP